MMGVAQKNIVLADSSKFGRRGFAKICGMDEVDVIITEAISVPRTVPLWRKWVLR